VTTEPKRGGRSCVLEALGIHTNAELMHFVIEHGIVEF
jgi:hypothetical protein